MPLVIIFIILFLASNAHSKDVSSMWAQLPQEQRDWFQNQIVPGGPEKNKSCCNISDGVLAQEDIEDGHYVVTFKTYTDVIVTRMIVPDEAIIKGPNKHGRAVVWYYFENGLPKIRCFIPGSGL